MLTNLPPIILASKSPRRQELLRQKDHDFRVVLKDVEETYPEGLSAAGIAEYLAEKKAGAFEEDFGSDLVLTADTIVAVGDKILGKPEDYAHALEMLSSLSGKRHEVITGVCLMQGKNRRTFHETTAVYFGNLNKTELDYYIKTHQPFDKAGAYGIQEWIGFIGIERIEGSYSNVVGLPTYSLYQELKNFCL